VVEPRTKPSDFTASILQYNPHGSYGLIEKTRQKHSQNSLRNVMGQKNKIMIIIMAIRAAISLRPKSI